MQVIPLNKRCNKIIDCQDGTDEEHCKCLDYLKTTRTDVLCDGISDCYDLSDEDICGNEIIFFLKGNQIFKMPLVSSFSDPCKPQEFRCRSNNKCIPIKKKCDGSNDCLLNEDEMDCGKNN